MFTFLLVSVSILFSAYYLCAVIFLYKGLSRIPPGGSAQGLTFSVVIAAHNEEQALRSCLDNILDQTVSPDRYEVIVVNDRSTDRTGAIADEYSHRYPNVKHIKITGTPTGVSPKKHAVVQGIARSRNRIIVFTDADCTVPRTWLDSVDRHFTAETALVQGITTYSYQPGMNRSFFGFQAVDFLSHGVVAASAIGAMMPLNSNANNLAFRKEVFEELGGYGGTMSVVSGDDDLLLQRIWRSGKWKIRYMTDSAGAVTTLPTFKARGIFEQRKRWGSKIVHYNPGQVAFLGGIFLFYFFTIAAFFSGFVNQGFFLLFFGMYGVKVIGELILMFPGTRIFHQEYLRPYIVPSSIIQLPMVLAAVVIGVFGKFRWKEQKMGRRIRR